MALSSPLAHLLRPHALEDVVGQSQLIGPGAPLRVLIEQSKVTSLIFWGPPGVGKTTVARILAAASNRECIELSAVSAKKDDIRAIVERARSPQASLQSTGAPVLFLDEIHRFTKSQQDTLLPYVEDGTLVLIGATTENPSFTVISPLLSRCRVCVFESLTLEDLRLLTTKAADSLGTTIDEAAQTLSIRAANGDARQLLGILEATWQTYGDLRLESLEKFATKFMRYDRQGEEHYDVVSAFIKSLRASNPDAALYYLARMVESGEDPEFIARRMVVFASEDIGLAQPTALVVANAVFDAVKKIGYPEAQINLAHGAAYLAQAKKDRSAYDAYFAALADVQSLGNLAVPKHLRNAPTKLMKELGYGKGYEMYPEKGKSLLPKELKGRKYLITTKGN